MRVLSNWRLHGLLGLVVVAGGLGWMASEHPAALPAWTWPGQATSLSAVHPATPGASTVLANYGRLPLHFEPNVGQTHHDVKFMAQGGGYALFLTNTEAVLRLRRAGAKNGVVLRTRLEGANTQPAVTGNERQESYSNYFIGNDPRRWHSGVPHYSRVHYNSVWPGIDLVYYGNQRQLEYDFIVQPGANPGLIRMSWHGADNLYVDNEGNLIAETVLGPVRQHKPVVYQTINGQRRHVDSRYALAGNQVSFELGSYDRRQPLVIDPILSYSTYLGGGTLENFSLTGIATTSRGGAVVAGYTDDANIPVSPGSLRQDRGGSPNTVVARLGYGGNSLVYSTYLGGNSNSSKAAAIAINEAGEAYVAGSTQATDFPLTPAATGTPFQSSLSNSKSSGFLTRLAADGKSILYSTYLGGTGGTATHGDRISALAINAAGQAYVTGTTDSAVFPASGGSAVPAKPAGSRSGFVSSLSADGSTLVFSRIVSGSGNDQPAALALGNSAIVIAGTTSSTDLPAAQGSLNGSTDAFVSQLAADGSSVTYSRYVGGSNDEAGYAVAVDSTGKVWLAGSSKSSSGFADASDSVSKTEGVDSPFLTRLESDGSLSAGYTRILGSAGKATAVAVNHSDAVMVAGQMTASFPLNNALSQVTAADSNNGFIQLWDNNSNRFSSALGGSIGEDSVNALALDAAGAVYLAGTTRSSSFPTENQIFGHSTGTYAISGFVSKVSFGPSITVTQSSSSTGINKDFTLGWTSTGATSCEWRDPSGTVPVAPAALASGSRTLSQPSAGSYDYTLTCTDADGGKRSSTVTMKVLLPPTASVSVSPNPVAAGENFTFNWSSTDANSNGCTVTISYPDPDDPAGDPISFTYAINNSGTETSTSDKGSFTYTLSCAGPGSETPATAAVVLEVVEKPTLALTSVASATPLLLGDTVTYTWSATPASGPGAVTCNASGVFTGTRPASGSETVAMSSPGAQTLTLKCTGAGGTSAEKAITVNVLDQNNPPLISSFTAAPNSIRLYQNTVLNWKVSNAFHCDASAPTGAASPTEPGNWNWTGNPTLEGSWAVKPQTVATHSYTLTCQGPGGSSSATVTVDVTPPPPVQIVRFAADLASIPQNQSTILRWQASNADGCVASGDWSGNQNTLGNILFKPTRQGSHEFVLTCTGATGGPAVARANLTVTAPVQPDPETTAGDDGGPIDLLLLGSLALLGLARRPQAR